LGVALLAFNGGCRAIAMVCAILVSLLGCLTLIEYIFNIDLAIDQLLMEHYIVTATSHPGRMAPNTALNFYLSGMAISLLHWGRLTLPKLFSVSILGSLVTGLGFVAMLGYLSQIETAYGWGKLTRMALHTSFGFVLMGILLVMVVVQTSFEQFHRLPRFFLSITSGLIGLTVTVALWQALYALELQMQKQYGFKSTNFIAEAILVAGMIFSVILAIAILFAEKLWLKIRQLEEAQVQIMGLNHQLEELSYLDSLTGIPNRRMFDLTLEKEWGRALRLEKMIALIFIDVDYFKLYNDYYGHQQGDRCLRQVAQVIRRMGRRTTDLAARYGGEEFILLLPDSDQDAAMAIADRIVETIRDLNIAHQGSPLLSIVTVSAGVVSLAPRGDMPIESLTAAADYALYLAKQQGRNRAIAVHSDEGLTKT
jgi:diguanylate cyclase (GGDEF)-like protein